MNAQFFDDLSNFLRASFLLFHSLAFYYILFWRIKIEPSTNKKVVKYFFAVLSLNFTLNLLVLFKDYFRDFYPLLIGLNTAIIGTTLFYGYKRVLNFNFYYLLLPIILLMVFIFQKNDIFAFLGLFFTGISYFHLWYKEKVSISKPSNVIPSIIKKGTILPFVFFGSYYIFLCLYLITHLLVFNVFATIFALLSLLFRAIFLYEEKFKAFLLYISVFIFVFSVLFYFSLRFIEDTKNMDAYHKEITLERVSFEIKNKIDFFSDFIKVVASSEDFKIAMRKGTEQLDKYLSYLNQTLDTALIWFADKNGIIKACSAEYRETMVNKDVSFRSYFKESINGKLSVFIARGVYTGRDDIRVSYPVYEKGSIIGVLVFQFDITENFKKQINMENAFLMHSSGGILIGKPELINRLLFSVSEEELNRVYEEKLFGNDKLLPSGFKQVDGNILIDYKGQKWQIVKWQIINDWFLASFLNLSIYDRYKAIFFIGLLILAFISHSFSVRNLERLRTIFLRFAEEAEEKRIAFDAIDAGIIYTDAKGRIKYMNKEAMRVLDVSEEVIEKNAKDLLILKDHENPEFKILRVKEKEIPVVYDENSIQIKGVKLGDVITIKDATEIIQRQEVSRRLEKMDVITKISAGIVHDFSNYLMVLTGNLSLLKELETSEDKKKNIEKMIEATKMMNMIVEQLKDLSPDFISKREKINIEDIARSSATFILNGTKINFTIESAPSLFYVYADSAQLYRVFQNILMNARQAMENTGTIKVSLQNLINHGEIKDLRKGNYVCITITDSGPGIPEEYIDKIFDPFFTMKKEGKGLGLSIVKSIIEKMGGKIKVESKAGRGTTFRIYIPASEEI
ncbi:ATP-binding protein [Thermodesulfovibrio sp. TK110]